MATRIAAVLLLFAAVTLALLWRVDTRAWRRLALRQRALIGRYRGRVTDLRAAADEWRVQAHQYETWGRDMADRWQAEEERSRALRYQLDALTVGQPTPGQVADAALAGGDVPPGSDPAPDMAAWRRDLDRIRHLPETEDPR